MKTIVLFFILLLLSGCSGGPSNSEIETQVTSKLMSMFEGSDEIFKIENIEKINGFEKDSKVYIADIKYDLTFKKGIKEIAQQFKKESPKSGLAAFSSGFRVMAFKMEFGDFEAGHRVTKEEKVTFIKTENGWRIDSTNVLTNNF